MLALGNLREELILAVLPYQTDDLAERERVASAAERMAVWVIERGGHGNPDLPRYAPFRSSFSKGGGAKRARFWNCPIPRIVR